MSRVQESKQYILHVLPHLTCPPRVELLTETDSIERHLDKINDALPLSMVHQMDVSR